MKYQEIKEETKLLSPKCIHPSDESNLPVKVNESDLLEVDRFDGKLHIEWDPNASVTPIGQLPFFIQYLKLGHRFLPWVEDCPLQTRLDFMDDVEEIKAFEYAV